MTGLGMILKQLGVKIDPAEIEQQFQAIKTLIPQFAGNVQNAFTQLNKEVTELKLQNLRLEAANIRTDEKIERLLEMQESARKREQEQYDAGTERR